MEPWRSNWALWTQPGIEQSPPMLQQRRSPRFSCLARPSASWPPPAAAAARRPKEWEEKVPQLRAADDWATCWASQESSSLLVHLKNHRSPSASFSEPEYAALASSAALRGHESRRTVRSARIEARCQRVVASSHRGAHWERYTNSPMGESGVPSGRGGSYWVRATQIDLNLERPKSVRVYGAASRPRLCPANDDRTRGSAMRSAATSRARVLACSCCCI